MGVHGDICGMRKTLKSTIALLSLTSGARGVGRGWMTKRSRRRSSWCRLLRLLGLGSAKS